MSKMIDRAEDMFDAIDNVKSILRDKRCFNITDAEIESAIRNNEIEEGEMEDQEDFPLQYDVGAVEKQLVVLAQAKEEIEELRLEYNDSEIKDFLCDGEALKNCGFTSQELVEAMYDIIIEAM